MGDGGGGHCMVSPDGVYTLHSN